MSLQNSTPEAMCSRHLMELRRSGIHGTGAFALANISKGGRLAEYVGEIIEKTESTRRCEMNNEYIFSLDELRDIDGNVVWNPARFINHSCAPNCEAVVDDGHIWIVANRDIEAGEELSFNYGFDLADYR